MVEHPRTWDESQLLRDARSKAESLIADLVEQRRDFDRSASQIDPAKLASGQEAFTNAIDAARQTVAEIDRALQPVAHTPTGGT